MRLGLVVADDPSRRCALPIGLPLLLRDGFSIGRAQDSDLVVDSDHVARTDLVTG
mgnify:CR=1 FL=1